MDNPKVWEHVKKQSMNGMMGKFNIYKISILIC